jgi:hypothetical protein
MTTGAFSLYAKSPKTFAEITSLLETERKKEGALEMDTPSAITLHRPGYILSARRRHYKRSSN